MRNRSSGHITHHALLHSLTGENSCCVFTLNSARIHIKRYPGISFGPEPPLTEVNIFEGACFHRRVFGVISIRSWCVLVPRSTFVLIDPSVLPCQVVVLKNWNRVISLESCLPRFCCAHRWKNWLRLRRLRPHRLPRYRRRPLRSTSSTSSPRLEEPNRPSPASTRRAGELFVGVAALQLLAFVCAIACRCICTAALLSILTTRNAHLRLSIAWQIDALCDLLDVFFTSNEHRLWSLHGFTPFLILP